MCRLAAYIGPSITLAQFLLQPRHSLVRQSYDAREMTEARVNADGFGFGWFAHDLPERFVSPMPIWSDGNLPGLGRTLRAATWVGNVRSATPGIPYGHGSNQPFADAELLFLHNGYLGDFATLRSRIRAFIDPAVENGIAGGTDSEYVFALLRHFLLDNDMPVDEALLQLCHLLQEWLEDRRALLNIVVADGERLYATRHALNADCPSLYFTTDDEAFPGGLLVASEALTDSLYWKPVPAHHLLILDRDEPPDLVPLS